MPIGRYLLFAGQSYYASGGWNDFVGVYPTIPDAKQGFLDWYKRKEDMDFDPENNADLKWYHVIDVVTGTCVDLLEGHYCGGNPDERGD